MNVAKLLKLPLLIDVDEMEALLSVLPHEIYRVGQLSEHDHRISKAAFLEAYGHYINALKEGTEPERFIAPALSRDPEAFKRTEHDARSLLQPALPVVQVQPHNIDPKFRSMIFGPQSIAWGVQFSYPQLFHDPETNQIEKVDARFQNTELFQAIRRWVRHNTLPTPFLVDGTRVNIPIRLGKACFTWINAHPGLKREGLAIAC